MRIVALMLVAVLGYVSTAAAQQPLLADNTHPGDKLTITTGDGRHVRGRLVSDTGNELVISSDGRHETIGRGELVQVNRHRNRFLFGPLIGLGAGLAVGMPLKKRWDNEGRNGDGWLAITVAAGVGMGTLVDLFNGSTRTVYSRSAPIALGISPRRGGFAVTVQYPWPDWRP